MSLAGKTLFITGASRGIGLAIALRAARDGANIVVAAKTANALFAVGFDRRFSDQGVRANAVMPGGIFTPLQRHLPLDEQKALGWLDDDGKPRAGFKTPQQGASTSVWAAVGDELEGVGGLYLEDLAQAVPWSKEHPWAGVMPHALDPEAAERLWTLSVETAGAGG